VAIQILHLHHDFEQCPKRDRSRTMPMPNLKRQQRLPMPLAKQEGGWATSHHFEFSSHATIHI
jgi:hypothetical protein